ncbi:hypothetical protein [Deinococcus marmoris]|uniref:hypothetical protein n=1 Tax=Deinococcus marmoris TaxID=249408 RepID=UPI0004954FA7|nr:hypothetical protein [Deinococcus marmoris]
MHVRQVPPSIWALALLLAALVQLGVQMVKRGHLNSSLLGKALLVGPGHAISFGLSVIYLSS